MGVALPGPLAVAALARKVVRGEVAVEKSVNIRVKKDMQKRREVEVCKWHLSSATNPKPHRSARTDTFRAIDLMYRTNVSEGC